MNDISQINKILVTISNHFISTNSTNKVSLFHQLFISPGRIYPWLITSTTELIMKVNLSLCHLTQLCFLTFVCLIFFFFLLHDGHHVLSSADTRTERHYTWILTYFFRQALMNCKQTLISCLNFNITEIAFTIFYWNIDYNFRSNILTRTPFFC